jgi:hypothetical protein
MNDLAISGTVSTPRITGNWQTGVLDMQGDSYPENAYELYNEVIAWIRRYLDDAGRPLSLDLRLLYLNTSSIKGMLDICDQLEAAHRQGKTVKLTWHYHPDNGRIAELAEDFREDCTFPFAIQPQE